MPSSVGDEREGRPCLVLLMDAELAFTRRAESEAAGREFERSARPHLTEFSLSVERCPTLSDQYVPSFKNLAVFLDKAGRTREALAVAEQAHSLGTRVGGQGIAN